MEVTILIMFYDKYKSFSSSLCNFPLILPAFFLWGTTIPLTTHSSNPSVYIVTIFVFPSLLCFSVQGLCVKRFDGNTIHYFIHSVYILPLVWGPAFHPPPPPSKKNKIRLQVHAFDSVFAFLDSNRKDKRLINISKFQHLHIYVQNRAIQCTYPSLKILPVGSWSRKSQSGWKPTVQAARNIFRLPPVEVWKTLYDGATITVATLTLQQQLHGMRWKNQVNPYPANVENRVSS
jgi:hypothetical protein